MTKPRWYAHGKAVTPGDLKFILDEKRAEKLKRSKFLREQMDTRFRADADARKLAAALRRASNRY
ncbi:hypothetical protein M9980_13880 [Sphingomonas donggukensis]|uniref:Uncharacterized protein n=1 Tax=Sphingomonas donggukensis TaxID=2949093 RepID=A0ABY4TTI5_9SPHN|nr:hypothetical protein [Sphingomonas donggukensis]URW75592.1 hypothetical protein M9980_13880 [Sphingomonas donggukensis]